MMRGVSATNKVNKEDIDSSHKGKVSQHSSELYCNLIKFLESTVWNVYLLLSVPMIKMCFVK